MIGAMVAVNISWGSLVAVGVILADVSLAVTVCETETILVAVAVG